MSAAPLVLDADITEAGTTTPALGIPPAVWVCGAVLLGCTLGPTRHSAWHVVIALAVVALALAALSRITTAWTIALVLLALGGALWRAAPPPLRVVQWPNVSSAGSVNEVIGIATAWPVTTTTGNTVRVPLHVTGARTKDDWQKVDATFTMLVPAYPPIARGDAVFVIGTPRLQGGAESDGTLFASYLRVERANTEHTWEDVAHAITAGLRARIEAAVRPPESGLIAGMLLGEKSALDTRTRNALATTGTTHLVVISGWNISLVAGLLAAFGRLFGAKRRGMWAFVSLAGIVAYTLAVGAEPSVVRAAIMGAVAVVAPLVGRRADSLVALGVAAAAMSLWQPTVVTNLSFLFSLVATFGVLVVAPWLHEQLTRFAMGRMFPHLTEIFAVTFAAHLMTEPLAWYAFGRVSLIAPIVNVIVEPLVPPIMALGAAVSAMGFLPTSTATEILGAVAALPAWLFLRVIHLGAALPLAAVSVPQAGVWIAAACYAVPAAIILAMKATRVWRGAVSPGTMNMRWGVGGFAVTLAIALVAVIWTT